MEELILMLYFIGIIEVSTSLDSLTGPVLDGLPFRTAVPDFKYHEVVVPELYSNKNKLVSTFNQGGHIEDISIALKAFNESFILDLQLNRNLFSKSYIEKVINSGRSRIYRLPSHEQTFCLYHGHVRSNKHSLTAVSTCNGVSGFFTAHDELYHIEPAPDLGENSHRIYKDTDSRRPHKHCSHEKKRSKRSYSSQQVQHRKQVLTRMRRSLHGPYDSNENTRYVELYLVNDYRTFDSNGRDEQRVIQRSQEIANIVSRLYRPLNIYVALVGVEVWTDRDQMSISTSADDTLEEFLVYRKLRINPYHHNDNAQLITGTFFTDGVVGKAKKGAMCTFQFSGGVNQDFNKMVTQVATTVAHEMGHNFGMEHDNYTSCKCPADKCIMAATSGGRSSPTDWSSCSRLALDEAYELGMDYCLRNKPTELYSGSAGHLCGNGFVEEGEECDCGGLEECQSNCCNATTCRLLPQAKCATGRCCDLEICQPKAAATLCRASHGECDLPEFCDGKEEYCPADYYLQDGVQCQDKKSYCYAGHCKTHTGQCKLLWGTTGRVSDPVCFQNLNTNDSENGNCGYNWTSQLYSSCDRDDVLCGLLHCVHLNEKLMFWKDSLAHAHSASFLTIGTKKYVCRSAMLDVGLDMPDPGMVPDGAKCGEQKICVNHKCRPLSALNIPKCEAGCNNNGVCNSKGNCHCDEGYAPPFCDKSGNGGSIDSGPVRISSGNGVLAGVLVVFFIVLIGVTAVLAYYYRDTLRKWWNARAAALKHRVPKLPPRPRNPPARTPPRSPSNVSGGVKDSRPNVKVRNGPASVEISDPVLTGSTNRKSQAFVRQSPSLSSSHIRESFREISNPILISTTDRRSKAFVSVSSEDSNKDSDPATKHQLPSRPPPIPPHATNVKRSQSDKLPCPPPTRPTTIVPPSDGREGSRSPAVRKGRMSSASMRVPDRPPPPPVRPDRQNVEESNGKAAETSRVSKAKPVPKSTPKDKVAKKYYFDNSRLQIDMPPEPKAGLRKTESSSSEPSETIEMKPAGVAALKARFNQEDSSPKPVPRSTSRAEDRPKPLPKPGSNSVPKPPPKPGSSVVRSFNV